MRESPCARPLGQRLPRECQGCLSRSPDSRLRPPRALEISCHDMSCPWPCALRYESTDSGRLPVHLPTPERCRHSRHTAWPGSVKTALRESLHPQVGAPAPFATRPDNACQCALRPSCSPKRRRSITPRCRTVLPRRPGFCRMRPRLEFWGACRQEVGTLVSDR